MDIPELNQTPPELRAAQLEKIILHIKRKILENEKMLAQSASTPIAVGELKKSIQTLRKELTLAQEILEKAIQEDRVLEKRLTQSPSTAPKDPLEQNKETSVDTIVLNQKKEDLLQKPSLEKITDVALPKPIEELAQKPIADLYKELRSVYDNEKKRGYETDKEKETVYNLSRAITEKKKDIEHGEYQPQERAKKMLSASEELVRGMYHQNEFRPYHG